MSKQSQSYFQQIPLKEIQPFDECQNHTSVALVPGSVVAVSGIYLVCHSTRHMSNARCILLRGLMLPNCRQAECSVTYLLDRPGTYIFDDEDFRE
jgi:hypothetical protein